MKVRIKEIRRTFSGELKTQEEFADFLGISKSNLASYETGRRMPTDAVIGLICQKCNVNENWLRTGEGDMYNNRTRNQEIQNFANDVMDEADDSFKKRFFNALSKLNERDWETLSKIVDELSKGG